MTASGPSTCLPRWGARVADVAVKPIRQRMREALGLPPEEVKEEPYEPSPILVGGASEIIGPAKVAEILRQINNPTNIRLSSPRRFGKTSLLRYILESLPSPNKLFLDL